MCFCLNEGPYRDRDHPVTAEEMTSYEFSVNCCMEWNHNSTIMSHP